MPLSFDEYMAEKRKPLTFDAFVAEKADTAIPESFATTPQPASTAAGMIAEKPATPVWAQNLGREVMTLHKVLDPMMEPNYTMKGAIEQGEMLKPMWERYGPVLKYAPGAATGDPSDIVSMGRHGAKMAEEAPLQTLFDIGIAAGIPAIGRLKAPAPRGVKSRVIPKERIPTEKIPEVKDVIGIEEPLAPSPRGVKGKAAPAPRGKVTAKEPWEMSKSEWRSEPRMIKAKDGHLYEWEWKDGGGWQNNRFDYQHQKAVKQALSENKPVPAEVLKDYPELKAKGVISKVGKRKKTAANIIPDEEIASIKKQVASMKPGEEQYFVPRIGKNDLLRGLGLEMTELNRWQKPKAPPPRRAEAPKGGKVVSTKKNDFIKEGSKWYRLLYEGNKEIKEPVTTASKIKYLDKKLISERGAVLNPFQEIATTTSKMIEEIKGPPEIRAGVKEAKRSMVTHDEQIRNGEFIHKKMNKVFEQSVPDKNSQLNIVHAVQQKRNPIYYDKLTPQEKGVVKWMELELDKLKVFNEKYEVTDIKQMPEGVRYVPGSWLDPKTGKPYPMMYGKFSKGLPQAKTKKFMTYEEGMKAGSKMATTNLGGIIGGAWESLIRAKNSREMFKSLYNIGAEKGVEIQLVKGKPSKPIRMIESYRLLQEQGLTEGYEFYANPLLEKAMTFKTPDGRLKTLQGAVGVRKEVFPFVRAYVESPNYGMLSELNFVAKTVKLSFSFFHHVSLAMQEIANRRIPFKNIQRGLKYIDDLDPTMKILHEQGLEIFRGYEDVGYQKVYFSNLTGIVGQTARGAMKYTGVTTMRDFLFGVVQPGMKTAFAHDVYLKGLPKALKEGLTKKQWAREVVEMADGHFSGEHYKRSMLETNRWMAKLYFSPEARKFWQGFLLSPTWQREHMLIGKNVSKSFMPQKLIEYTSMKPISKTAKAEYRKYAYTAVMMVGSIDLYNLMMTKKMDGKAKHIWQNPEGKGFGVRAPWNDPSYTVTNKSGKIRTVPGGPAYIRPLKSIYEIAEWVSDPLQKFIYKLSPALSAIGQQFWPSQYRHYKKGWVGYPKRLRDVARDMMLPISAGQAAQVAKGKKHPAGAVFPFFGMPTSKLKSKLTRESYYTRMAEAANAGRFDKYSKIKQEFLGFGFKFNNKQYTEALKKVRGQK